MIQKIIPVLLFIAQDTRGNLYQKTIQFSPVPLLEHVAQPVIIQPGPPLQYGICLGNQLHIPVFDTVVNHLHVMSGTPRPYPFATRRTVIQFRGNRLKYIFHERPSHFRPSRHDKSLLFQHLHPAFRVVIIGVSPVNNHVPGRKPRHKLPEQFVHGIARLDH